MRCRELGRWKIRPAGMKGRVTTEGMLEDDVPRYFAPYRHGNAVGAAYREAFHSILFLRDEPKQLPLLHTLLQTTRRTRTGLADGEPVPDFLAMSQFHAHMALSIMSNVSMEDDTAEYLVRPA
jgi:hypothetical protein